MFFAPLVIIGLFRLQSALWLSDEGTYLPLGTAIIPCIQSTWYKVYTYLLILLAVLRIVFTTIEMKQG
jgi:hypothetical protein